MCVSIGGEQCSVYHMPHPQQLTSQGSAVGARCRVDLDPRAAANPSKGLRKIGVLRKKAPSHW